MVIFSPQLAVKLGLNEPKEDVDLSMYLFERYSQGIMDFLLAWILPVAALLMLLGNEYWPYLALVGGGVYLYFPGVFMITRIVLSKHGLRVGSPASVTSAMSFGALWIVSALAMIVLAILELNSIA